MVYRIPPNSPAISLQTLHDVPQAPPRTEQAAAPTGAPRHVPGRRPSNPELAGIMRRSASSPVAPPESGMSRPPAGLSALASRLAALKDTVDKGFEDEPGLRSAWEEMAAIAAVLRKELKNPVQAQAGPSSAPAPAAESVAEKLVGAAQSVQRALIQARLARLEQKTAAELQHSGEINADNAEEVSAAKIQEISAELMGTFAVAHELERRLGVDGRADLRKQLVPGFDRVNGVLKKILFEQQKKYLEEFLAPTFHDFENQFLVKAAEVSKSALRKLAKGEHYTSSTWRNDAALQLQIRPPHTYTVVKFRKTVGKAGDPSGPGTWEEEKITAQQHEIMQESLLAIFKEKFEEQFKEFEEKSRALQAGDIGARSFKSIEPERPAAGVTRRRHASALARMSQLPMPSKDDIAEAKDLEKKRQRALRALLVYISALPDEKVQSDEEDPGQPSHSLRGAMLLALAAKLRFNEYAADITAYAGITREMRRLDDPQTRKELADCLGQFAPDYLRSWHERRKRGLDGPDSVQVIDCITDIMKEMDPALPHLAPHQLQYLIQAVDELIARLPGPMLDPQAMQPLVSTREKKQKAMDEVKTRFFGSAYEASRAFNKILNVLHDLQKGRRTDNAGLFKSILTGIAELPETRIPVLRSVAHERGEATSSSLKGAALLAAMESGLEKAGAEPGARADIFELIAQQMTKLGDRIDKVNVAQRLWDLRIAYLTDCKAERKERDIPVGDQRRIRAIHAMDSINEALSKDVNLPDLEEMFDLLYKEVDLSPEPSAESHGNKPDALDEQWFSEDAGGNDDDNDLYS